MKQITGIPFIVLALLAVLILLPLTAPGYAGPLVNTTTGTAALTQDVPDRTPVVIRNVHLLTMESEAMKSGQTIVIRDGKIAWTGPDSEAQIPDGARVITGNYYVIPGLAEMHAHIPSVRQGEQYMHDVLVMYLAQGITTIRGMLGEPAHLDLREKTSNGDLPGPRIFTSGPSFNANSATDHETVRRMVREQAEAGFDLIKLHPGITLDNFNVLVEEAHSHGLEFSGHISYEVGLIRSLEAGQGSIDHLDRYMEFLSGDAANRPDPSIIYFGYDLANHADESLIDEAARLTAEAGVWNVPTNTLLVNVFDPRYSPDDMRQWPGMEYLPAQMIDGWAGYVNRLRSQDDYDPDQARRFLDLRNQLTLALHRHNAGLLLGADAPQIFNPPGFAAHRELALLVEAGLTPFEALKTATVNVGRYLGEENETGMVKEGFRADLLILRQNPLEVTHFGDQIAGVVAAGRYYDSRQLQEMLEAVRERAGN
ncbi:MAG: amidohydrolase [Balneolaceae bacterium]|nr:MAG: amidohydrolase [Balneolaceae bacterium]